MQAALEACIEAEKAYRLALSEAGALVERDLARVMLKSALDEPGEAYVGILLDTLIAQVIEQYSPPGGRLQFDLARVSKALGVLEGDCWRRGTSLAEEVVKGARRWWRCCGRGRRQWGVGCSCGATTRLSDRGLVVNAASVPFEEDSIRPVIEKV